MLSPIIKTLNLPYPKEAIYSYLKEFLPAHNRFKNVSCYYDNFQFESSQAIAPLSIHQIPLYWASIHLTNHEEGTTIKISAHLMIQMELTKIFAYLVLAVSCLVSCYQLLTGETFEPTRPSLISPSYILIFIIIWAIWVLFSLRQSQQQGITNVSSFLEQLEAHFAENPPSTEPSKAI